MSGRVLIDTSVWVEFFRGRNETLVENVSALLKTGRAAYTGIIALELLNGAKGQKDLEVLHDAFDIMQRISENDATFTSAGRMGYDLARKGVTASTVDLLIAQTAIENSMPLMTLDKHFDAMAAQTNLKVMK